MITKLYPRRDSLINKKKMSKQITKRIKAPLLRQEKSPNGEFPQQSLILVS